MSAAPSDAPSGRPGIRERFVASYGFPLDDYQVRALDSLDRGHSVVVAAPTGSGKTLVAEYAVAKALDEGAKCFYTTPIKALSNQKLADLSKRHGAASVGLLTGDNTVNERAPILVMTTEVLRNMLYARSPALRGLRYVVLDEVHFLQDAYRGPVWEEVIIHAPPEIDLVCLSATVSNAIELADWVSSVRGATQAVIHDVRPVELRQLYVVGDRDSGEVMMLPMFADGTMNPAAARLDGQSRVGMGAVGLRSRARRSIVTPRRLDVIERLRDEDLLPALYFIFSRAACDDAVATCVASGTRLTTPEERRAIRDIVDEHADALDDSDLSLLRFDQFRNALEAGFAAHHAGMVPPFKEAVEACFVRGLVKAVFATETLALGINMPARSVVIEKLTKFGGERHELLTPGEYTQLTGRAGRRGIDEVGYSAVLWNPFVTFEQVAALASRRTYELRSAFRPTYNMAVNLVRRYSREEAHHLLSRSFAQYQIDADLVRLNARADVLRRQLGEARRLARCDRGDLEEFRRVQRRKNEEDRAGRSERRRATEAEIEDALETIRPGHVIDLPSRRGSAAIISTARRRGHELQLRALSTSGRVLVLTGRDFRVAPEPLGQIRLPAPFEPNTRAFQKATLASLSRFEQRRSERTRQTRDDERGTGRAEDEHGAVTPPANGVETCPDLTQHLRAAARADRLAGEIERTADQSRHRATSLGGQLDRVLSVLEGRGYVRGWTITENGTVLAGLFHDMDLAVAEVLFAGVFDGLKPPQLAGLASCFVYERRGPSPTHRDAQRRGDDRRNGRPAQLRPDGGRGDPRHDLPPGFPKGLVGRWSQLVSIVADVADEEEHLQLPVTRAPDPGFASVAHAWASGRDLEVVLDVDEELTGGDFVRTVKTLIDLLRQVATVAPVADTRRSASAAADALHRGVVSASSAIRAAETSPPTPSMPSSSSGPDAGAVEA